MKLINKRRTFTVFFLILFLNIILTGCKKDPVEEPEVVVVPEPKDTTVISGKIETPIDIAPTIGSRDELTKDSMFLYSRQIYLWWKDVPDYNTFKPRTYGSFEDVIFSITRFGKNPTTNKPYEYDSADPQGSKYSYYSDITQQNPTAYIPAKQSSVDLEGNGHDLGLLVRPYGTETDYTIYVQAVYQNSPAEKAGFKRGDKLRVIDGKSAGTNYNSEINNWYYSLFESSSNVKLEGTTGTGANFVRTIKKAVYKSSPIYKDSVYTSGSKKIGYMAYARFSNESNSIPEFNKVFTRFSQAGITDLIVDLRYNGGGYVSTAEYLINLIAPSSLNGKVMFTEYYNELMQAKKATILKKQPLLDAFDRPQYQNGQLVTYADIDYSVSANTNNFKKEGSVNSIQNVVFIVSSGTASASELVINSLKPHMNVKIVGSTSYGKPVGFFPVRIDKYDVYFSMFETRNSKNEGGYYAGFTPDTQNSTADNDNPNYEFGDLKEASFLAAYNYITKGYFIASGGSATISSKRPEIVTSSSANTIKIEDTEFKGMIQSPHKMKRR
ncbi:MAG: hypothetical protein H7Y13_02130 [Sphingobacteriaceae bacterium]|nr:hypothetical protein [Sphingobacteriaceae bacterium]